jgi:hypothetical protein
MKNEWWLSEQTYILNYQKRQLGKPINSPEPQATPGNMACQRGAPVSNASNHPAQVREIINTELNLEHDSQKIN